MHLQQTVQTLAYLLPHHTFACLSLCLDLFLLCSWLSYGQTGSGKTWTMEGGASSAEAQGIIPRSMARLFEASASMAQEQGWTFEMESSHLEVYNEQLRDLLGGPEEKRLFAKLAVAPPKAAGRGRDKRASLGGALGGPCVPGLSVHPVKGIEDVEGLLEAARSKRSVAATKMNAQSSRSHSVFILKVKGAVSPKGGAESVSSRAGHLVLVDLAGSEKVDQSGVQGQELKEATAINKSLSSLGNVIQALAAKRSHVPYRDSALTSILASCLGGDSKCLMLVNVSPNLAHASETMSSLRFAQQVNNCELGAAKKNG